MFFRFSILKVGHRNFRIESGKEAAIELFMTITSRPAKPAFHQHEEIRLKGEAR